VVTARERVLDGDFSGLPVTREAIVSPALWTSCLCTPLLLENLRNKSYCSNVAIIIALIQYSRSGSFRIVAFETVVCAFIIHAIPAFAHSLNNASEVLLASSLFELYSS